MCCSHLDVISFLKRYFQKCLSFLIQTERKSFLFRGGADSGWVPPREGWLCSSPVSRAGSLLKGLTPLQPEACLGGHKHPSVRPTSSYFLLEPGGPRCLGLIKAVSSFCTFPRPGAQELGRALAHKSSGELGSSFHHLVRTRTNSVAAVTTSIWGVTWGQSAGWGTSATPK